MEKINVTGEQVLDIWYSFALDKPKQKVSLPQDEWVAVIRTLHYENNIEAASYVAGFFNGDIKIFDGKDKNHKEIQNVTGLH